jgi:phosphate transport system substrate-binding protein
VKSSGRARKREFESTTRSSVLPVVLVTLFVLLGAGAGCGGDDDDGGEVAPTLSGRIELDGSSTVQPFAELAAERFLDENPGVAIFGTLLPSRTHGGFERFCEGETDLSSASRRIEADERRACRTGSIEYLELQVANDALTVAVNPENDWAECLTLNELKKIWEPDSDVESWSEVRRGFPDEELELVGPGKDSGTYDYFTEVIVGKEGASRSDYVATDDDNATVERVAAGRGALGYFGLSYFTENEDRLKALQIDGGSGCVAPSVQTAQSGDYAPLSRPLFIYVNRESLQKPAVREFVEYVMDNDRAIAQDTSFVPLTDDELEREQNEFQRAAAQAGA